MIVNIGQDEYTSLLGESAGARVVVHGQNHMPFPEDEGFVAKPGKLTSAGIRKVCDGVYVCKERDRERERDIYSERMRETGRERDR